MLRDGPIADHPRGQEPTCSPLAHATRGVVLIGVVLLTLLAAQCTARAGEVVLKNGFRIEGIPVRVPGLDSRTAAAQQALEVPQIPYWLIDDGIRRYFVHRLNVRDDGVDQSDDSSRYVRFELHPLMKRRDAIPTSIGSFAESTDWNEFGHRRVTLMTPRGPEHVHLAITRLDPRYLTVKSTSHTWDFAIAPTTLSVDRLHDILLKAIDPSNPDERLAVVAFFLQSNQLSGAKREIEAIQAEFPELAARTESLRADLFQRYGLEALREIQRMVRVGQPRSARFVAHRALREPLSASTLREAREVIDQQDAALARMRHAIALLGQLQAELDPEQAQRLTPLRSVIESELSFTTLPRLQPFLQVAEDASIPADERLALAYSGWLLGAADARSQLSEAIALWDARALVLEYLLPESDQADRAELLERLKNLEGISVPVLARMIPQLPPPREFPSRPEATIASFEIPSRHPGEVTIRYSLMVPPEYDPARSYPLIVTLPPEGRSPEDMLRLWGGTVERPGHALREGYIVLSPEFARADAGGYDYGKTACDSIIGALDDARSRVNVDSDRVFLSGHGMGGDAAFDLGLARPDIWAGILPVTAKFQHAAAIAVRSARHLPMYIVGGEYDRDTLTLNAKKLVIRMQRGDDLVYCEYKGRGFEPYAEEIPRMLEWMSQLRRPGIIREIDQSVVRDFHNRIDWLKWVDLPPRLSEPIPWEESRTVPRPMPVSGKIYDTGLVVHARHPGKHSVIWLSPDHVTYEDRVKIIVNGARKFDDFLRPDLEALLDDLAERGDRQRLYWTRLAF